MVKKQSLAKPSSTILVLAALVIAALLVLDFLYAFSSSSSSSLSTWVREKSRNVVFLNSTDDTHSKGAEIEGEKLKKVAKKWLSLTYADIPAPELKWEEMMPAPVPRLDGYAVQIKNRLYVFVGYENLDHVHSHVDMYNFTDNTWSDRLDIPKEMANSHLGIATDGRYIYVVSGQYGPQCRGPTAQAFVLDTETKTWTNMPPLPAPRYAPATQLWKGRLHVMGGSKENRHTPGTDHWSIAVEHGKALEKTWRNELPIPRGGPHRACVAVDKRLYVIGGQEGDFMIQKGGNCCLAYIQLTKPGSPIFKCSRRHEVVYGDVYMLDDDRKWKVLPPMPKPNSHIECSWVLVNNSIIIVGGTTEKHPVTKRMILVGEVFQFDIESHTWSVIGRLPYRVKTTLAGYWNGWLYFTSGQRDRGPDNPSPRKKLLVICGEPN